MENRLDYIKDYTKGVGSKILYINSMYKSNDDDHMVVEDHKELDSLFGTMDDFDNFLKVTKQNESMYKYYLLYMNKIGSHCH